MARLRGAQSGMLMQQIGRLFLQGSAIGSSEGELLDRFARGRDESAFEALVARHGPMVLGVCRQLLRDPNDVDDAFQATFLVLVRKAGTLRRCDLLGNWLYGVAYRVAFRARSLSARRMARFGSGASLESLPDRDYSQCSSLISDASIDLEPRPWLHQEVSHLPEKYRTAIVLCYFEGLTHDQAASRLGCPLGTVKGRLSRARSLLRRRLTRRGVALSAAAVASQLTLNDTHAAVPAALEMATSRAALSLASHAGLSLARASSISIPITTLAEGVLQTMIWNQVRVTAASLLLAGTLATGMVVGAAQLSGGSGDGGEAQAAVQESGPSIAQGGGGAVYKGGRPTARAAGAAIEPSEKSVNPDLSFQIGETNRSFDHMLSRLRDPDTKAIDRLSTWSNLMLSADLVLASTPEAGMTARAAHRDRMKKLHEQLKKLPVKKLPASAKNQAVDVSHAEEKLREAEFLLENGGSSPSGSGMMMGGMASQMGSQMRGMMGGMGRPGGGLGGPAMGGMMGPVPKGRTGIRGTQAQPAAGADASEKPVAEAGSMGRMGSMGGGPAMGGSMMGSGGTVGGSGGSMGMGGMGGGMFGGDQAGFGRSGDQRGRGLSLALVSAATELAIRDKNPKSKLVLKKLETPITMKFEEETPLEDVVKHVKQATTTESYKGIPIYVDPVGLSESDKTMTSTVRNMHLEGVPLKTTLRLLLRQVDLAYCVRDGVLIISSPQVIFDELREAQQELDIVQEVDEPKDAPQPK